MICFRDRTFCDSDCTVTECWRRFGAADRRATVNPAKITLPELPESLRQPGKDGS